ncbi:tautomerase family protein [Mangrovimonas sp. YM274]|uniref:tautomerase family protein n=1 Tax=Mangrovimonas sp. YM274 TaxID=3070660 RepID=UPI0027DCDB87|nr:tautomerase family protein [Mangrovimonas sp. YM274]WMI68122.1 tautomerase family protein [Mangrovimonas sp. YM274]
MPHIQVKLLEGKTEAQKQELTKALIEAAQKVIGFGEESYSVSIEDFSLQSWEDKVYPQDIMGDESILYKTPGYSM